MFIVLTMDQVSVILGYLNVDKIGIWRGEEDVDEKSYVEKSGPHREMSR